MSSPEASAGRQRKLQTARVMGELRSRVEISQHGPKIFAFQWVSYMILLFGSQGCLSILYSLSCATLLVFYLPTGDDIEPMSDEILFTMKLTDKGELTRELQLITSQRNKLQARLFPITEGTVDNRYASFQTSLGCRQCPLTCFLFGSWLPQ